MRSLFLSIRPAERRLAWTSFWILFGVIGAHTILETARDALFLARASADRLPIVYIAIALASLGVTQLQDRLPSRGGRGVLVSWLLGSAGVTLGIWLFLDVLGTPGVYVLYVWSGVLVTLVMVHFWRLVGGLFSITQAKRLYGMIGTGSVLGAIGGSALAGALTLSLPAHWLLPAAAAMLAGTSFLPAFLPSGAGSRSTGAKDESGLLERIQDIMQRPYARSVVTLMILGAAALTVSDFLFKRIVADAVPAEQLGSWLARFYLAVNIGSLFFQVFLVRWALTRFSVLGSLAFLPLLIGGGAISVLFLGGTLAAILLKAPDGLLKHSINKTAVELLFVPMSERLRRRVKTVVDVIGQRGGQGAASLVLLGMAALEMNNATVALLGIGLAGAWLLNVMRLREPYLNVFRAELEKGNTRLRTRFPELDLAGVETLVASLNSTNDEEVVAAMHLLAAEGRTRLLPTLILYHPSSEVLQAALSVLSHSGRAQAAPLVRRLIGHDDPAVRAAALLCHRKLSDDLEALEAALGDEQGPVRAAAAVALSGRPASSSRLANVLSEIRRDGDAQTLQALADAIVHTGASGFDDLLIELSRSRSPDVRVAAAGALGWVADPARAVPPLLELLCTTATREAARAALCRLGDPALDALVTLLNDEDGLAAIRVHVPRALAEFPADKAAAHLLRYVSTEPSGQARARAIRALELMARREHDLSLDSDLLDQAIRHAISEVYRGEEQRLASQQADEETQALPGYSALARTLRDKARSAGDRLLRLLGLRFRGEDFSEIRRGLNSRSARLRASSIELMESALPPSLRPIVVRLLDDPGAAVVVETPFHRPQRLDYNALLNALLDSPSVTVRAVAAHHVGELRLQAARDKLTHMPRHPRTAPEVALALSRLEEAHAG